MAGGAHLVALRFARLGEPKESRGRFRQDGPSNCIVGQEVMDEPVCVLEAAVLLELCVRPVTSPDQTIDAERCPEQRGGRARNGAARAAVVVAVSTGELDPHAAGRRERASRERPGRQRPVPDRSRRCRAVGCAQARARQADSDCLHRESSVAQARHARCHARRAARDTGRAVHRNARRSAAHPRGEDLARRRARACRLPRCPIVLMGLSGVDPYPDAILGRAPQVT